MKNMFSILLLSVGLIQASENNKENIGIMPVGQQIIMTQLITSALRSDILQEEMPSFQYEAKVKEFKNIAKGFGIDEGIRQATEWKDKAEEEILSKRLEHELYISRQRESKSRPTADDDIGFIAPRRL